MPRDYNVYAPEQPGTQWQDGTIVKPPHKHKAGGNGLRPCLRQQFLQKSHHHALMGESFSFL